MQVPWYNVQSAQLHEVSWNQNHHYFVAFGLVAHIPSICMLSITHWMTLSVKCSMQGKLYIPLIEYLLYGDFFAKCCIVTNTAAL